jgi:hypothetical protein
MAAHAFPRREASRGGYSPLAATAAAAAAASAAHDASACAEDDAEPEALAAA